MARNYSSIATEKTLAADVTNVATQITLNNITGLPTPPYTLVLNPDTTIEEIITVDADQSGVTAPTLRVTRAQEGTTAQVHTTGQSVKHMITARDLQDAQDHISATESVHGISDTTYLAYTNSSQTLTNKTMSGSVNSFSNIPQSAVVDLVSDLAATDTALSNHSADTTDVHGIVDTSILVTTTGTQTLTNKTLTSPKINDTVAVTASSAELNILDGATLSTTELNYVDGVTSAIQTQINTLSSNLGSAVPTGTVSMFAGTTAPTGYLICDGTAVSRTTYAALFTAISTTYGAGDTTTTFNLPDLRGRAPIGVGTGSGLTARTLGGKVGAETHTLVQAEIADHVHGGQVVFGTGSGNTGVTVGSIGSSQPTTNTVVGTTGQPHNNMQPSFGINFIIKH